MGRLKPLTTERIQHLRVIPGNRTYESYEPEKNLDFPTPSGWITLIFFPQVPLRLGKKVTLKDLRERLRRDGIEGLLSKQRCSEIKGHLRVTVDHLLPNGGNKGKIEALQWTHLIGHVLIRAMRHLTEGLEGSSFEERAFTNPNNSRQIVLAFNDRLDIYPLARRLEAIRACLLEMARGKPASLINYLRAASWFEEALDLPSERKLASVA